MFGTSIQPGTGPGTPSPAPSPASGLSPAPAPGPVVVPAEGAPVPLERLEAEICEIAGHLTAATCRFLVLLGDFDDRRGWASWDMNSCAQWLSWKCQMSSGTAREHVRVARALRELPVIRDQFAAARLSYAKVRALTRIATPDTEQGLAEIAGPMTGNQLERFARAHRKVTSADDDQARVRRRLAWRCEDDGSLSGTFKLPALEGAALLKALRAAAGDLEHPHDHPATPATTPGTSPDASTEPPLNTPGETSSSLADALVAIAETYLAAKITAADNPDVYQVIVHVGTGALESGTGTGVEPQADTAGVSAETPGAIAARPGDPAAPGRCHADDGPAVSQTTASMLTCTATLSWMLHDHDGTLLDIGRRSRKPTAALRRAVLERDQSRCRYPGCDSRRVDLHHIRYWSHGGKTRLDNMISLCRRHHRHIHQQDCLITAGTGGTFTFHSPDGTQIPPTGPPPEITGQISGCHDTDIGPGTIIPPWYGERLNLDHAIWTCFANAETHARRQREREHRDLTAHHFRPKTNPWEPDIIEESKAIHV